MRSKRALTLRVRVLIEPVKPVAVEVKAVSYTHLLLPSDRTLSCSSTALSLPLVDRQRLASARVAEPIQSGETSMANKEDVDAPVRDRGNHHDGG